MLTLCASGLFSTVSLFLLVTHATHSSCTANPHRLTFPWPQDARQTHVESTLLLLRGHVTSPTPTYYLCLEVRCILHLTVNINSKWTTTLKIFIRCGKNTNFFFFFWKLSISFVSCFVMWKCFIDWLLWKAKLQRAHSQERKEVDQLCAFIFCLISLVVKRSDW